ncbi:MAG: hypothetical protein ACJ8M4_09990 [Chthoniobacterales bacterium]
MSDLPFFPSNIWLFGFLVAAVLLAIAEGGYQLGLRLFSAKDEGRRSQIGGVQAAILGLLGLLLGFTFSMAVSRYEARRDLLLKEANCIGTTWLRASLLPEAQRAPVRELLLRFVRVRLETEKVSYDSGKLAEGLRRSAEIEKELWQQAEIAAKEAPTPITATFIVTLNEMIDTDAERVHAGRNRIPATVWVLLILVAACGCLTSAYGSGAQGARSAFTSAFLPLLISIVIFLIFDLRTSHQGMVSVSQEPMLDLEKMMQEQTGKTP